MTTLRLAVLLVVVLTAGAAHARDRSPIIPKPVFLDREDIRAGRGNRLVYALDRDFHYCSRALNAVITVPRSFVTDFISVPSLLQWAKKPHAPGYQAAIIHDWLYASGGGGEAARERADYVFYEALGDYGVSDTERSRLHFAVRQGGSRGYGLKGDWMFVDPDTGLTLDPPLPRDLAPALAPSPACTDFPQRLSAQYDFLASVRLKPR
ncbi:DUF1353 domain-containing protein [uncultured Brevundimonas sp.]|uniref:DUF1353 domain-containing protein n=1 Tax=uncultured Brevundimonas sp. TaxID=213418 RepID=UPI0030EE9D28|tara:strand:- start:514 stop:1137 length:624 start_codon:yes stop_codon:yes gene_type:complete